MVKRRVRNPGRGLHKIVSCCDMSFLVIFRFVCALRERLVKWRLEGAKYPAAAQIAKFRAAKNLMEAVH